jgi:hypothetical protein
MAPRPQYYMESPSRQNGKIISGTGATNQIMEQTRYNDIMRSINNTEQFIKAKQVMAAQEKKAGTNGRNNRKNLNLTDINAIANSTNSSLMNNTKSPFDAS